MDVPSYDEFQKEKLERYVKKQQEIEEKLKKGEEMENNKFRNLVKDLESINTSILINQYRGALFEKEPHKFTIGKSFDLTYENNVKEYNRPEIKNIANEKCKFVEEFFKSKNYPYSLKSSDFSRYTVNEKIPCSHTIGEASFYREDVTYYDVSCTFRRKFF